MSSAVGGGDFKTGFIAAGLGAALGPVIPADAHVVVKTMAAAAIGGTLAQVGGGKFANGAVTAAFAYAAMTIASDVAEAIRAADVEGVDPQLAQGSQKFKGDGGGNGFIGGARGAGGGSLDSGVQAVQRAPNRGSYNPTRRNFSEI